MVGPASLHQFKLNQVSFANNGQNRVAINGDEPFIADVTLTNNPGLEAYELVEFYSKLIVPKGITLTLELGVTLLAPDMYASIQVSGHVEAEGTAVSSITFTSITNTLPGEWGGLTVSGTASLDHAIIRYGENILGVVDGAGEVSIANSEIGQSSDAGLYVSSGQVTAVCTTFANNNSDAVYVTGSPDVRLLSSSLTGNGRGVNNQGSTAVDARQNWWGDTSGPSGTGSGSGDAVWGNVMYDPWLTEPTCTLTPYRLYVPLVIKQ
jgi:hypothetical protein